MKKLFYEDAYLTEFDAVVTGCEEGKNGWIVTLDQTAFYPEGGGQPTDKGYLEGSVRAAVTDVHEKNDEILHTVDHPLQVGETVHGTIDWARRFDHMQQHSGEHIVSGMICSKFQGDNVGFHLGADIVTIDYNREITMEDLLEIEERANRYLWENHPVHIFIKEGDVEYRFKKELEGDIRLVEFPGADCCACCGTHVKNSAEVGIVKFLSVVRFREGVRIELLCGERAYRYLRTAMEQNQLIGKACSVKNDGTYAAVARMQQEIGELKVEKARLFEESCQTRAKEFKDAGNVLLIEKPLEPDAVRKLAEAIADVCGGRVMVFAGNDGDYKYVMIHHGGEFGDLVKKMNAALSGRGGGRNGFAQGSVKCTQKEIEAFCAAIS